jgi:type IV pilus assembly protein PilB
MHLTEEKLKNILLDSGLVSESGFNEAKEESRRSLQPIITSLIGRGLVPEDFLAETLAPYFGAEIVNLQKVTIPSETLESISESYAKSKGVVVFEYDNEKKIAKVAMTDPLDLETIEFLRADLNVWIVPYLTTGSSLKYGLKQFKKQIGQEFNKIIEDNISKSLSLAGDRNLGKTAEAVPIITILNSIIEHAAALGSSDIHFEPWEKDVLVRYRIDGVMHEILTFPKVIAPILVARVKVLANLLIDEHRVPQDGRFRFEMEDSNIDVRVNIMPVFHGEKVEMRLLKTMLQSSRLEDLGMSPKAMAIVVAEMKKTHGMILVTGPTGHGKTTTLYTILHILNAPEVNITTIEDPIEYEMARVNQTQVNAKAGITFANGLRSLLRQNPDIIMVGEIRDSDTVEIAVHAALTGHLVLSTLHTNDAPTAIPRFIDMGAQPFLLASTMNVVVAQRLVRKICTNCAESYVMTPEMKKIVSAQIFLASGGRTRHFPERIFRGKGCKICNNSGFRGQIGVFEVMRITDGIRNLIMKQNAASEIRKIAVKEGMETLFEDGLRKVEKGITTIEEIIRVVQE